MLKKLPLVPFLLAIFMLRVGVGLQNVIISNM